MECFARVIAMITALNIAYDEEEKRSFIKLNAIALALTLALIVFMIITLAVVISLPVVIGYLNLGETVEWTIRLARWPILAVAIILALAYLPVRAGSGRAQVALGKLGGGGRHGYLAAGLGRLLGLRLQLRRLQQDIRRHGGIIILLLWFNLVPTPSCWGPNSTRRWNTRRRGIRRREWSVRSASGAPMSLIRWGTSPERLSALSTFRWTKAAVVSRSIILGIRGTAALPATNGPREAFYR